MFRRVPRLLLAASLLLTGCGAATTTATSSGPSGLGPTSSAGCTAEAPATAGTYEETVTVGDQQRRYIVHVPTGYAADRPTPLVLSLHGSGSTAAQQLALTGITASSDKYGFVVVAPQAVAGQWQLPAANGTTAVTAETTYLRTVLSEVDRKVCLDHSRQYASGMSLGSIMTFVLACAKEQTFAAFGGVGATFYRPVCGQSPPAPLIYFHGVRDTVVPIAGGTVRGFDFSPVQQTMAQWAAHNRCAPTPATSQIGEVTRFEWGRCAADADVDYYRVAGAGHTWPGGPEDVANLIEPSLGKTTRDVSANDLMWEFFSRYRLPS
jgi:polyhydroxybutyrate depolymerase